MRKDLEKPKIFRIFIYNLKLDINIKNKKMLGKKIRVSTSNSKVMNGRLFISGLKAVLVSKSKVLAELVNHGNSITYPGLGKLVEYNGPYIRVIK